MHNVTIGNTVDGVDVAPAIRRLASGVHSGVPWKSRSWVGWCGVPYAVFHLSCLLMLMLLVSSEVTHPWNLIFSPREKGQSTLF